MPSLKNDDSALSRKDVVFILAIAKHIEAQSKTLPQDLDKSRYIYYAYSIFDSLSSSYSMFKYFFDVYFAGSTDEMHDLMLTPEGIIGITLETVFLVGFSFFATYFDKAEEGTHAKRVADAWPYFRDVIKGLKNAYKGWRSVITAMGLLGMLSAANSLILPVGLALGVLGALNRLLIRSLREARKSMMAHNKKLLINISKLSFLSIDGLDEFFKNNGKILTQSDSERYQGFFYSALGGFVDGLYLYAGVLTLTLLAPYLLIPMAITSVFFTLACIITRLYEEKEYQDNLIVLAAECSLAAYTKQIQTLYDQILTLEKKTDKNEEDLLKIKNLKKEFTGLLDKFDEQRELIKKKTRPSSLSTLLLGLRNGLYAYSALSSILFFVSGILVLAFVAMPPALIIAVVAVGLALVVGFIVHAFLTTHQSLDKEANESNERTYSQLSILRKQFETNPNESCLLTVEELNGALKSGLTINRRKKGYLFQEWFEVLRSLFSGFGKGFKFVDFAGNFLQEIGQDGHYHDTPLMFILGALSACLLFGPILALRALAKGFGRPPLDSRDDLAKAADVSVSSSAREQPETKTEMASTVDEEVGQPKPKLNEKPATKEKSALSFLGIFATQKHPQSSANTPEYDKAPTSGLNTILGLN